MKTLVTRDEFVGEGQTGHQATLLQPEDRSEGTAEKDALDSRKCNETLSERGLLVGDPPKGPIGLLPNARDWNSGVSIIEDPARNL